MPQDTSEAVAKFLSKSGLRPEDFQILKRCSLFSEIPEDRLCWLLGQSTVQNLSRGHLLFMHQDEADRFFFIFDGWVKLYRATKEGQESVIAVFSRGETFAEAAIFERAHYPVSAAMVSEGRLLSIPAASFLRNLGEDPDVMMNMMASMSRHLRHFVVQIEQLTAKSSLQRLAEFLARLSAQRDGRVEFRLPLDKALIAGRLGMKPETFSRSLARLRNHGVETKNDKVLIEDVSVLIKLIEGDEGL